MELPSDILALEGLRLGRQEGHEEGTIFSVISSLCNCALDTEFSGTRRKPQLQMFLASWLQR